jgi:putative flippase GtrA
VSHLIALVLSVLWNFTFNRKFTFKSANNIPLAMLKVAVFYAIFTPVSTYLIDLLVGVQVDGLLAEAIMMVLNFVLEFIYSKFFVFNPKFDIKKKEKETQKVILIKTKKD